MPTMGSPMRTLGFRTHVLLAIAGAIGLLYSLTRPWYAAAPPPSEEEAGIGDSYGSLAALAIVAWKLVDPPGANGAWELRIGALLAGVFAIVLFTCASGVANAPLRRK